MDDRSSAGEARATDDVTRAESFSGVKSDAISDSATGKKLGDFRLLRRLGRGGMAEVFLAEQTSLKRQVALKIVRADTIPDETYLKRFEQEARAAAGLNHANIVQVFSIGEVDGVHYIAQEYVHGRNLREYLNHNGPPDADVAIRIMKQVAAALRAAAEAGIVHRDIKPENIMLTRKGEVKVTDFGLAQLARDDDVKLTKVGVTMGTPLYMSPEQVSGRTVDARSDIYSFGVTCYHLLAGQPPFQGDNSLTVAVKHLNDTPPPLQKRRADLPLELCQIVHKMMEKDPATRYANAGEILADLKRLSKTSTPTIAELNLKEIGDFQSLPKTIAGTIAAIPQATGQSRRQLVTFAAICVFMVVTGAVFGWARRPPSVWDTPPKTEAGIPPQKTAVDQFSAAMMLVGHDLEEEAWKAVELYHPDSKRTIELANAQLGMLYLRTNRLAEAETKFRGLAYDRKDAVLNARGLGGLAVVASLQDNAKESQRLIAEELFPLRDQLGDEMAQLVRQAIQRNRQALGGDVEKDYERLFER